MLSIVAVLDKEMTKVPTKLQLDAFKDMNIKDICSCEFRNDADNHRAHFVSRAMALSRSDTRDDWSALAPPLTEDRHGR